MLESLYDATHELSFQLSHGAPPEVVEAARGCEETLVELQLMGGVSRDDVDEFCFHLDTIRDGALTRAMGRSLSADFAEQERIAKDWVTRKVRWLNRNRKMLHEPADGFAPIPSYLEDHEFQAAPAIARKYIPEDKRKSFPRALIRIKDNNPEERNKSWIEVADKKERFRFKPSSEKVAAVIERYVEK